MIRQLSFAVAALLVVGMRPIAWPQEVPTGEASSQPGAARDNNLGAAYMNQQQFEKALKAFEDAHRIDPQLPIAELNRGIALLNLGRTEAAKPILEQAAKQEPNDAHAWYNLGLLYKNTNDPSAAERAFRRVTEIDPNDADSWYFVGASASQGREYAGAIQAFEHALKINPQHASAEFGLARAYQRSDDLVQARNHLDRFQHIRDAKLGLPISLAYGEQGKYSLAEESPLAPLKVAEQIKVHFVDVTEKAGLATKGAPQRSEVAWFLGPGACFLDYDGDGKIDLFLPDNGREGGMSLYHNLGGRFEEVTRKAGLDSSVHAIGCTSGDYDNDGFVDLVVGFDGEVRLLHNEKNGTFKDVTEAAGIKAPGLNLGLTLVDYDHDGDLDLFVTQYSGLPFADPRKPPFSGEIQLPDFNQLWRNNGTGTFTEQTKEMGISGKAPAVTALATDFNNDRAVDLVVSGSYRGGAPIFENPREGRFQMRSLWPDSPEISAGAVALDFNHDGWMDLAFTHWAPPGVSLWRNNEGKGIEQISLPAVDWVRGWGIAAIDYDNDGWIDLVATGENKQGHGELRLFRNLGPDGFQDVTADVGLDRIGLEDPRAVITGDYDNDGATDLLITQNHGPALLLRNEGGNRNHWLRLELKGLADNKSSVGTKVEVFSDGNRQKFEIAGAGGYLGQNSQYLTAGLGQAKEADIVRMLWPTGVLQDETELAADREQKFTEIDRRGSSCPTLFVWDGRRYALVADMLGAGVIGHWIGPGQRNIPRPTEYVKVEREMIHEKDGKLSFRFMEPLEEAVYLDQVELLAVDHPKAVDVYPNEYFASNPPYPPFKVVFSEGAKPPVGAWDDHGHNVLAELLAHRYVGDFDLLPFAGFAKPHSLELDLGEPYKGGPLWLLLHGEIEYFSATGMYAASQAGIEGIAPYVEALTEDGKWQKVVEDMGFPAGGPRMMTADLTGKLPVGARRIRITTNLQIYWDEILIDRTKQAQAARITPVPLARAELRFHGFPLKIEGQPPGNVRYVYEEASATGPYTRPAGVYTRYGDVRSLVTSFDDRQAVFGSGDEVAMDFDSAGLPALAEGWVRDYFFMAHGYEKDMDFYAAQGNSVDPLPYREMETYPYAQPLSLNDDRLQYLLEFNTRFVSGNEAGSYSFRYLAQP